MARNELYTGLDIGSSTIRVVVGQRHPTDEGLQILGAAEGPAEGISKGTITSIEDAVSSISATLEKVERMTGVPVEHAAVSINGVHVVSQDSHGIVAVAKADGEIKQNDVDRVIEAAQSVATPPNYEILHVVPRSFTVDNQHGVKDPIGMSGMRLEVDAQVIQGLTAQIKNLQKAVYRTKVDIDDMVLAVLASSLACVSKRQKELGVAVVNIGSSTTSLMVFEEGDVMHTKILPVGASHITNDIAIGLRISIDLAEKVKLEYGTALPDDVQKRDDVNLGDVGGEAAMVSRRHIAEIIQARVEEIFSMVDRELQHVDRSGLLPAGIILTGGGAKLPGLTDVGKKEFRLPVGIGWPQGYTSAVDKIQDPAFTTALGLASWTAETHEGGPSFTKNIPGTSAVTDTVENIRRWVKGFIP
ncbi:MAG: cell division protein FtsA [Candidatus Kerfeldbacteria bacterium]|nr:cell division protein FtsA [Candidatus Kerfeldbacteria bacterium]